MNTITTGDKAPHGILDGLEVPLGLGLLSLSTAGRPEYDEALAVIHFALRQGVRLFDTADSYALDDDDFHFGERLIQQAVQSWGGPQEEVRIATKVGLVRPQGRWVPCARPEHLRRSVDESLQALDVDQLFLLQLHARDPNVPFEETLGALAELQREGKVRHLGVCNIGPVELQQAQRHFRVASLQSELNLYQRRSAQEGLVEAAKQDGIPFLAARPLGGRDNIAKLSADNWLRLVAGRHDVTPAQIALAALQLAGPHVIPLVGATRMESIRSSLAALEIALDVSDQMALSLQYPLTPHTSVAAAPRTSTPSDLADVRHEPGDAPEVVLLMGIQGAGKSELVGQYIAADYARLNRDELGGTLEDLVPRLQRLLAAGQNRVVLDNTYPTRTSRAGVIAAGRAQGVPVRCRHLNTPLRDAHINIVLRMLARYGMPLGPAEMTMFRKLDPTLPPPQALQRWVNSFEPPQLDEGFASVEVLPFERRSDPQHTAKGLLLDVDGTLRRTRSGAPFLTHPDDVEILPNRTETLRRWVEAGYLLFFVSNQAGIALGHVSHEVVQAGLVRTAQLLEVPITEIVYCPHPSQPVGCFCRKPMPGLGVALMQRHGLHPRELVMVGDRSSDAEFASAIGATYHDADAFFATE